MAGQIRQIRRRIRSVDKIRQITRAMELVATSKIKKAEDRIKATRPYAQKMVEILQNLATQAGKVRHPLLETHSPIKKTTIMVLTSNRGLCGAFNTNVLRRAEDLVKEEQAHGREVQIVAVGRKAASYLMYRDYPVIESHTNISDAPTFDEARMLADGLMDRYIRHDADQVYVVFSHFRTVTEQRPVVFKLFPLEKPESVADTQDIGKEYLFEPSAEEILSILLPAYAETVTYRTLLESAASEHGARRTAMKSATDNSSDMIGDLTLILNRARQAQITQELAEISGAVEALKYTAEKE